MKSYVIGVLSLLFSASVYAQDVTLTKGETVEYLNKKFKELDGRNYTNISNYTIKNLSITFKDGLMVMSISEVGVEDGKSHNYIRKFNPLYITKIWSANVVPYGDNTGQLQIYLKIAGTEAYQSGAYGWTQNTDVLRLPFLNVNDNDKKITKALLHLQALLKAEDDPFGN